MEVIKQIKLPVGLEMNTYANGFFFFPSNPETVSTNRVLYGKDNGYVNASLRLLVSIVCPLTIRSLEDMYAPASAMESRIVSSGISTFKPCNSKKSFGNFCHSKPSFSCEKNNSSFSAQFVVIGKKFG